MARENIIVAGKHPLRRISWGAIFGGVFVAFTTMLILNTLGLAVGLSVTEGVGTPTAIWSVVVVLISLFGGGWTMSYLMSDETKKEAAVHGAVMWGVLFFGIFVLAALGIGIGMEFVTGATAVVLRQLSPTDLSVLFSNLGLDAVQLEQLQQNLQNLNMQSAAAAWWSLLGMVVSLAAVIGGSFVGRRSSIHDTIDHDRSITDTYRDDRTTAA